MSAVERVLSNEEQTDLVQTPITPIAKGDRIAILDILRGLAIFGILIMNIQFFSYPDYGNAAFADFYPGILNQVVKWGSAFFFQTKFYSIFSLLFGVGMAVLFDRSMQKNTKFTPFFSRRLLILLCIGLFHGFVLWDGDILMTYALIGFALLAFKKRTQKTIMIWAASALIVPFLLMGIGFTAWKLFTPQKVETAEMVKEKTEKQEKRIKKAQDELRIFAQGSFAEQIAVRTKTTLNRQKAAIFYGWRILGMFLLGVWAWRKKLFQETENHIPFIKRILIIGLTIGLAGNALFVVCGALTNSTTSFLFMLSMIGDQIGATALSLFYIAAILLLVRNAKVIKYLLPFASVGRMALSNYLFHTLICTTIFYSYGLGLYGKFGPAASLLFVLLIYVIQIPMSKWWLKRFKFGPVEWLWRSLTYGKRQPMRLSLAIEPASFE